MKRIKLTVAYDGTEYCGWQIQDNALTIEEILNDRLSGLLGEDITVMGASRTDSGVHALGNVAVFDTNTRIPPEKLSFALNQSLPDDITIQKSEEVPQEFHPRYSESLKTYEYRILNRDFPIPTLRKYTHFVYRSLDFEKMQEAARCFVGEHDFKSFCSAGGQTLTTIRTIKDLTVDNEEDVISIRVTGNGFLYNMVRIIAGTLIQAGLKVYPPDYVMEILKNKDRKYAGPTAPAKGLTLIKIEYL